MQKSLSIFLLCLISLLFYQCSVNYRSANKMYAVTKAFKEEENEEEDGIKEAQEMEFKLTRDVSLGYIPKDRLIKATNELYILRKNNNAAYRENALGWVERGPYLDNLGSGGNGRGSGTPTPTLSGRIRAIWVDLNDASNKTVWAGSASGGLWKTTNITASPATWIPVNDFFGNLAVSSICQNPAAKNTLYFGTGEKTYNSDAVRGGGIWKSTDAGATWTLLANSTGFYNVSKIICDAAGNLYVATVGSNGILRSADGGNTWTNITPAGMSTNVVDINLSSTGSLHIVVGYFGSSPTGYRYTASPATVTSGSWTTPATTFSNTQNNTTLASNGNTIYATPSNSTYQTDQVWKSTDGGANWAITGSTPPVSGATPLSSGQGWYCQGLAVDPANANNVMVGGLNSYRSTDGGTNWTVNSVWVTGIPGSSNYIHADHQVYAWSTGNQLLCAGDGGLFYSGDGGTTFTDKNQGLRIKQFYSCALHPTLPNYFLAGAQDNGVHQLNGSGLTSSLEVIGGDGAFVHIDENEPNYQFGAYTNNQYRVSTDGGNSFNSLNFSATAGQFINPTDYDDINNNFYGSWTAGNYLRWINAPLTANYFATPIAALGSGMITHVRVSRYTSNRVLFGADNGKIIRADNANTASPAITDITGTGMPASSISCIAMGTTENNLLATFSNYGSAHVWISTTGGGTAGWTNITGNLPDIPVRWAMLNPEDNTKAILATEMGVYETSLINGAATAWVQNTSFPVVRTDMLKYRYSDNTILAATHGRGLWSSTISPQAPYIRFSSSYIYSPLNIMATSVTGSSCRNYKDYIVNMHIDAAPSANTTVNLTIAAGATATQGKDFDFTTNGSFTSPSAAVSFASAATTEQPITIRVYNQTKIGSNTFFTLNYTITGGSNALKAPSSSAYTFNIGNNNTAPVAATYSGSFTLGTYNTNIVNNASPFRGDLTKNRIQYLFTAAELTAAGVSGTGNITSMQMNVITKNSTQAYTGFTIALANTTATTMTYGFPAATLTQVYSANYSTVSGNNLFNFSTPFVWDGTSNVLVNMCFDNGSAISSYDIVSGTTAPLGTGIRGSSWSNGGSGTGCTLSAAYVADYRPVAIVGVSNGISADSILNDNRSEFIADNAQYFIINGGNVISSINNSSANLGCVTSTIFMAGNTWSAFQSGQASQKIIQITPATNGTAAYTVGLYYTLAELGGKVPAGLKIAKTSAASMAAANSTNTVTSATTVTAFGSGYVFTANFTGFSKFFLVDNNVVLPVELVSFTGVLNNLEHAQLQWRTTNQFNLRNFEVQRSDDGLHFTTAGVVEAVQTSGVVLDYNFTDPILANAVNFYRLKMVDMDGRFKMSNILLINNTNLPKFVALLENPVKDHISILLNNIDKENIIIQLYNSAGQLMKHWEPGKINGSVSLPLGSNKPAAGLYTLKISAGDKMAGFKISIQ